MIKQQLSLMRKQQILSVVFPWWVQMILRFTKDFHRSETMNRIWEQRFIYDMSSILLSSFSFNNHNFIILLWNSSNMNLTKLTNHPCFLYSLAFASTFRDISTGYEDDPWKDGMDIAKRTGQDEVFGDVVASGMIVVTLGVVAILNNPDEMKVLGQ